MDEMTLLRETPADDAELTSQARAQARRRLTAQLAAERARRRRRRRATAAVAVAAAATVLGVSLDGGDGLRAPAPSVEPAAANALLMRAADGVRLADAPAVPRGDQYIYKRQLVLETRVDGHGEPQRFVDELWDSVDGSGPSRSSERGRSWTTGPREGKWPPRDYEGLAELPTDPAELRDAALERFGGGGLSAEVDRESEYMALTILLRAWQPVMPPGLRAATIRALAQLPEVRVREGVTDAKGRVGLGISAPAFHQPEEMVVDARTSEYLGQRSLLRRNDGVLVDQAIALVEAGVVDELGERP